MSFERPTVCIYCDGHGNGAAGPCGFCENGAPLDTQEDWDRTWGHTFRTVLSPEAFDALLAELDRPPEVLPKLRELFERGAPWDAR